MKHVVVGILLCAVPQAAFAWGHVGHAVVADIAESRLTPQARKSVKQLLAVEHYQDLSDVASWADEIKSEHLKVAPAHSLRLPLDHSTVVDMTMCPGHYCAAQGIMDYYAQLKDKSLPLAQREMALKFLVHLVGDIHQPLHAAEASGSGVKILTAEGVQDLHWVWDDDIIYVEAGHDPQVIAKKLEQGISTQKLNFGGDATDWALESRDIARDVIYLKMPKTSKDPLMLPPDYEQQMWPIVAARLTQAGVRLADLLNKALQ